MSEQNGSNGNGENSWFRRTILGLILGGTLTLAGFIVWALHESAVNQIRDSKDSSAVQFRELKEEVKDLRGKLEAKADRDNELLQRITRIEAQNAYMAELIRDLRDALRERKSEPSKP